MKKRTLTIGAVGLLTLAAILPQFFRNSNTTRVPETLTVDRPTALQRAPAATTASATTRPAAVASAKPNLTNQVPVLPEVAELYRLKGCYELQSCAFPQTDPRSYELALGHAIQKALVDYWERNKLSPTGLLQAADLARTFVANPDPFVQEACLKIFASLPTDARNLQAITDGLRETPDPLLITQTLGELQRYVGTADEAPVHTFLAAVIAHGGQLASEAAAQNILPFINTKSIGVYRTPLREMRTGTQSQTYLMNALREYDRLVTGG